MPKLSIIVICFNMRREAQRTLHSLSDRYQQGVSSRDYEVIVIDNNSSTPLEEQTVREFGDNFGYHYFDTNSKSPASAVNYGAEIAKGQYLGVIVDGARMLTPGIVRSTIAAVEAHTAPFVCTLAWHLGPKEQNQSMLEGYDQKEEDRLLNSIDWPQEGYRLFDIASLAPSSNMGLLAGLPYECSYFAMKRSMFMQLQGFDERFQSPGGGLVNHEFLQRVLTSNLVQPIVIVEEGSFHQFHGGIASNSKPEEHPWLLFADEYKSIFDKEYKPITDPQGVEVVYLGTVPAAAIRFVHNCLEST